MNNNDKRLLTEFQQVINEFLYDFSDCSICNVCCKDQKLTLNANDINMISNKLNMDKDTFLIKYTNYHEEFKETDMNIPCLFLKNNRCEIYDFRPEMCRNFPVFIYDDSVVINNIEECAKATHLIQLFFDFCQDEHPEHYKLMIKEICSKYTNDDNQIISLVLPLKAVALFFEWLWSK